MVASVEGISMEIYCGDPTVTAAPGGTSSSLSSSVVAPCEFLCVQIDEKNPSYN